MFQTRCPLRTDARLLCLTCVTSHTFLTLLAFHSLPITTLFTSLSQRGSRWASFLVNVGAIAGLTTLIMAALLSQTRIFYAMAADGLLPKVFRRVDERTATPVVGTVIIGGTTAVVAALVPVNVLAELTSLGTLLAFIVINVAVLVLRRRLPHAPRAFETPLMPYVPIAGTLVCAAQVCFLDALVWARCLVWLLLGLLWYCFYGHGHGIGARHEKQQQQRPEGGIISVAAAAAADDRLHGDGDRVFVRLEGPGFGDDLMMGEAGAAPMPGAAAAAMPRAPSVRVAVPPPAPGVAAVPSLVRAVVPSASRGGALSASAPRVPRLQAPALASVAGAGGIAGAASSALPLAAGSAGAAQSSRRPPPRVRAPQQQVAGAAGRGEQLQAGAAPAAAAAAAAAASAPGGSRVQVPPR